MDSGEDRSIRRALELAEGVIADSGMHTRKLRGYHMKTTAPRKFDGSAPLILQNADVRVGGINLSASN